MTEATGDADQQAPVREQARQARLVAALLTSVSVGIGGSILAALLARTYGFAVFLVLPFCVGAVASAIYGSRARQGGLRSILVGNLAVGLTGLALCTLAIEGVVCLFMAAPLWISCATVGAAVGLLFQAPAPPMMRGSRLVAVLTLLAPLTLGAEWLMDVAPPVYAVSTAVEIDAPREEVWRHVIAFPPLEAPREWLLRAGIAYPISATIRGEGVGATRYCTFSTGSFVEPIQAWNEPSLLQFAVTECPPPMREWSPWGDIHPPHLDGYMVSKRGQFELLDLPGGRTRLVGTTWYSHGLWPAAYWRLWSDATIHTIHRRVLNHIKQLAEVP